MMSTSTLPHTAQTPAVTPGTAGTGFWRAPFSSRTFREVGYTFTSLLVAIVGFTFAVAMFSLSAGLAVTVIGLPVAAAMLAGARGLGTAERGRARRQLGLDVAAPAPVRRSPHSGRWSALTARLTDPAGWKALLFQILMFPWRVASFVLSLTFLVTGWAVALYPAYRWVFPRYVGWPGYPLYDYTSNGVHHHYYLTSPLQIGASSLLGLVIVFLTPQLVRALTNVDRAAVRGLLGK
ncbi:sensor domain-containing protein [Streptomyces sp. NBC_01020]|uniref:sensor domain-containing protein n=1 Tax=unclassified Streptomyces TaxID=2593676 RepID=UPI002E23E8F5|nr:sensor domain-containing protein [Streptomyces sp. NBC_01020]WSX43267.1 sensor domain-containing protein [Streptomyces sp. NBC_00963]